METVFISLRGYKYHLILSGLFVLLGTICVYLAPFVTSFTLDYVIQGSNEDVPAFCCRYWILWEADHTWPAICIYAVLPILF